MRYDRAPYGTDAFSHNCYQDFIAFLSRLMRAHKRCTVFVEGARLFQVKLLTQLYANLYTIIINLLIRIALEE